MIHLKKKIKYLLNESIWCLKYLIPYNKIRYNDFSIGITTFLDRYDKNFKKLLKRLVYLFPENQIIITVNGHYQVNQQEEYLKKITAFCEKFINVHLIKYSNPQGLSKLWNQIILNSENEKIIILNDDIRISPLFKNNLVKSKILNEDVSLINNSFSHFFISKKIVLRNGWFDERFEEIGGEDDDYHVRLSLNNIILKRISVKGIWNLGLSVKVDSYGNKISAIKAYSQKNTLFLFNKWDIRHQPFPGSHYIIKSQGNFWKLKEGMKTPNFYK